MKMSLKAAQQPEYLYGVWRVLCVLFLFIALFYCYYVTIY